MNKFGKISTIAALVPCGKDCPTYMSHKQCEDASTKDSVCLWCDKVNMCISSNDEETRYIKVNGCGNVGSLNVSDPSEPTPNKQEVTNEEDIEAESENDLKKTTEKHEPHVTVSIVSVSSEPTLNKQRETNQLFKGGDLGKVSKTITKTIQSQSNGTAETTEDKQGKNLHDDVIHIVILVVHEMEEHFYVYAL
ncbi:unnamed protein product [Schistosoma rodhaini]|uniref:Uncharacterized protein n=1 Tax=Schistosoma rodhaini TaxID=6188 RepID=A0AA85G9P8_9TREM|nr:unnamed protein product [Schistosoma rodhaini]